MDVPRAADSLPADLPLPCGCGWSTGDDPDAALVGLAAELELDRARFTACLASRKALERVLSDLYDAQAIGVRSTPTFILLYGGTAQALAGARSAEEFAAKLQQQVERAKAEVAGGGRSE
jgi:predicted DsbA family dithiol-disulfide isomerase